MNLIIGYKEYKKQTALVSSLEQGFLNFMDGDFSASLPKIIEKKHILLYQRFDLASKNLRDERQKLYQREMLLDKVLNASPVITILVNHRDEVIFANTQSQQLFLTGSSILGQNWRNLISTLPEEFQTSLNYKNNHTQDTILSCIDPQGQPQAWHIATSTVRLNQATHTLYLLKTMTEELAKQESNTWKKVIKVLSHELNNSIAPISSMCHSGKIISEKLNEAKLDRVFNAISKRINHLSDFVTGYSSLAKLRQPIKKKVFINELLSQIQILYPFKLSNELDIHCALNIDQAQFEQVLVNLLKNADEADPKNMTKLGVKQLNNKLRIDILDSGTGMSNEVLQYALLPFYSTKHTGTGLGLALCRDIIEAHQGKLLFSNLSPKGFCVSVILPLFE